MTTLWYFGRGSGVVALVLLTVVVVLGIGTRSGGGPFGLPRLRGQPVAPQRRPARRGVPGRARGGLLFDPYAQLRIFDLVVPFVGHYRPFWLGLGTLAVDLVLAIAVTSLLRHRIGVRAWRVVHWLAYLCWPVALLHGLGTGTDGGTWWLWAISVTCAAAAAVRGGLAAVAGVRPPSRHRDPASRSGGSIVTESRHGLCVRAGWPTTATAARAWTARRSDRAGAGRRAHRARRGRVSRSGASSTAVAGTGRPAVVIANGAEGEPASGKDRALLAYRAESGLRGSAARLPARSAPRAPTCTQAPPAGPAQSRLPCRGRSGAARRAGRLRRGRGVGGGGRDRRPAARCPRTSWSGSPGPACGGAPTWCRTSRRSPIWR